jgi:hypothetical protein
MLKRKIISCVFLILGIIALAYGKSNADPISSIKGAALNLDKSRTIGEAIEGSRYVDKVEWSSFQRKQGQIVVEARAQLGLDFIRMFKEECKGDVSDAVGLDKSYIKLLEERKEKQMMFLSQISKIEVVIQFQEVQGHNPGFQYSYGGFEVFTPNGVLKKEKPGVLVSLYRNELPVKRQAVLVLGEEPRDNNWLE